LVGAFTAGATSCAIQILIPLIASSTDESRRGQVIGNVMSGLMLGILLSRPLAGIAADSVGWRGFYIFCAVGTGVALLLFRAVSSRHEPPSGAAWPSLIASFWEILRCESVVRQAALRQALCMCAFNMFWTSVALRLSLPPFDLSEQGIAIFALAGAAGVFAAPLAGRLGDKGQTRLARRMAYAAIILACGLSGLASSSTITSEIGRETALVLMTAGAFLLDLGVIIDQALGRREINLVRPQARGRINGLFTGLFFIGGAIGALTSGIAYASIGWTGTCAVAGTLGAFLLLLRNPPKTMEIRL
jgi:predicted MFS family arabinose efflux permease